MLRAFRRFRGLEAVDRRLVLELLWFPFLLRVGFTVAGVGRTAAVISRHLIGDSLSRRDSATLMTPQEVICRVVRLQEVVARNTGYRETCLLRSLVLSLVLARCGICADLRIGVRQHGNQMEGHAWLEFEGKPINDDPMETGTYVVFPKASEFHSWGILR